MDLFINLFNIILYRPLFNILILLYQYLPGHNFGLAIIVLTILTKILFYPLGISAIKSQKAISELQPKMKEVQEKYKDDKEQQTKAIMELYKKSKINPFSGCLPLLVQLPVLFALYKVFWRGLQSEQMVLLYNFVPVPGTINSTFFGIIDLAQPNLVLTFLVGISQFLQVKMSIPRNKTNKTSNFAAAMQKQMQYFTPVFMVLILLKLPSALGLYLLTTTLFTIVQQYFIFRKEKK